jgi:hypothetical protein
LVTNEAAVFHARNGETFACPLEYGSQCWMRSSRYRNSTQTPENASMDRA